MDVAADRRITGSARGSRPHVSESDPPRNNLALRVTWLENEVKELKAGQPAVMAERVGTLSRRVGELRSEFADDIGSLRSEMRERDQAREKQIRGFQRIFVAVFTGVGVAVASTVIALVVSGGSP